MAPILRGAAATGRRSVAFSAFLLVLFVEIHPSPVRLVQMSTAGVDWFTHDAGHHIAVAFGWEANPHLGPFHVLGFAMIAGGFRRPPGMTFIPHGGPEATDAMDRRIQDELGWSRRAPEHVERAVLE